MHVVSPLMLIDLIYIQQFKPLRIKNSAAMSFVEGCPLLGGSKCIGKPIIWDPEKCPLQRGLLYYVPILEGPLLEVHCMPFDKLLLYFTQCTK